MKIEEAIKSMRNLDDVISITASEHESVKLAIAALEKQIKPEEAKALQGSMMLVGQWISRETQARKYSTDEVMNISKALMDLRAHFDKLEVAE